MWTCVRFLLLPFVLGNIAVAQSSQAIGQLNQDFAATWVVFKPVIQQKLVALLQGLAGRGTNPKILQVAQISVNVDAPPKIHTLSPNGVVLLFPGEGDWSATAALKVRIKWIVSFSFWVTVSIQNLKGGVWAVIDGSSDPLRPVIKKSNPWLSHTLSFSSSDLGVQPVAELLDSLLNTAYQNVLLPLILEHVLGQKFFGKLAGLPKPPYGTGSVALVPTPDSVDLLAPALAIDETIIAQHMPWDTCVDTLYSQPYQGGVPVGYSRFGDSAIWTGHYLAAQAFRHAVTGDPTSISNAQKALRGIARMFAVTGTPGWLARNALPIDTPYAQKLLANAANPPHVAALDGDLWVGGSHISRDQYLGVMMGMGFASLFFNDPAIQQACAFHITNVLNYLLENQWIAYRKDGKIATSWLMRPEQQLAWLAMGKAVNPSQLTVAFEQYAPLSEFVWFALWLETTDPLRSYFKFNLSHGALATLMRFDTDPLRWERYYKALKILRHAVGHHPNAHFNLCEILNVPSQAAMVGSETKEALKIWLERPRRFVIPDPVFFQTVEKTWCPPVVGGASNADGPDGGKGGMWISKAMVPISKRLPTEFVWQRSPFEVPNSSTTTPDPWNHPYQQFPGIDYLLPYWMSRYTGVIGN